MKAADEEVAELPPSQEPGSQMGQGLKPTGSKSCSGVLTTSRALGVNRHLVVRSRVPGGTAEKEVQSYKPFLQATV